MKILFENLTNYNNTNSTNITLTNPNIIIDTNNNYNSNNNITIINDTSNKCDMFGEFGMYVQIVLAGLSFLILICKIT